MKNNGFRLKGHVKLTLTDVKTGKKTVRESDNIITDALADIMRLNLLGGVDYSKIMGSDGIWKKWFGGIMCYSAPHANLDKEDYFMPNNVDNPVTAHAGMTPIDSPDHDDDPAQGNPLGSGYQRSEDSMKITWTWDQLHGNGLISALSLCHADVGSYGNGVESYHFKNTFTPFEQIQSSDLVAVQQTPRSAGNAFVEYDQYHALSFFIGEDGWYKADASVPSQEDLIYDVTVYIRRLPYTKMGLFDVQTGSNEDTDVRKFTVTTSTGFKYNPSFYFDPETKYLWLFRNFTYATNDQYGDVQPPHTEAREWSKNTVWYSVIDCNEDVPDEDREVDHGTIVSDDNDLTFLEASADGNLSNRMYYGAIVIQTNIMKDGDYVYVPIGNGVDIYGQGYSFTQGFKGFKKINIANQGDQETIPFVDDTVLGTSYCSVKQGDLAMGFGWVMNGGVLYPCSLTPFTKGSGEWAMANFMRPYPNEQDQPVIYMPVGNRAENAGAIQRYIMASKLVNTSKINIDPVQKTASHQMTVEYTITEVPPSPEPEPNEEV